MKGLILLLIALLLCVLPAVGMAADCANGVCTIEASAIVGDVQHPAAAGVAVGVRRAAGVVAKAALIVAKPFKALSAIAKKHPARHAAKGVGRLICHRASLRR